MHTRRAGGEADTEYINILPTAKGPTNYIEIRHMAEGEGPTKYILHMATDILHMAKDILHMAKGPLEIECGSPLEYVTYKQVLLKRR